MTYTDCCISRENVSIDCHMGKDKETGKRYPVLKIGTTAIFASESQLEQIHAAIGAYLSANVRELQEAI